MTAKVKTLQIFESFSNSLTIFAQLVAPDFDVQDPSMGSFK